MEGTIRTPCEDCKSQIEAHKVTLSWNMHKIREGRAI